MGQMEHRNAERQTLEDFENLSEIGRAMEAVLKWHREVLTYRKL